MFYAKTKYAGKFKALFEMLFQNMTSACFTIDKDGWKLEHRTTQNMLLSVFLPAANFEEYKFDDPSPIHVGLGSNVNKEFFKYVKNKDVLIFSITKPFLFDFEKKSDNKADNCQCKSSISIETIQNITPYERETYTSAPVKISAVSFNQLTRSFNQTSTPTITLIKSHGQIKVSNDTGISSKTLIFGEENTDSEMNYHTFEVEQFSRISKISSFVAAPIEARVEEGKPVYLKCSSDIGVVEIYIYSAAS